MPTRPDHLLFFFFNDTATTEIYTLSLHDALPICSPTAQTQYGSAGERIFLEVAPQRTACNHPLIKDFQCLRVREIRYGDNGVKTSTGEGENFYSEIEGYKHEPGIPNVLRIQRYKRQNVP